MNGCRNIETLVTKRNDVCTANIVDHVQYWAMNHLGLLFVLALVAMGVCSWFAAKAPNARPLRGDNINYQLQNINNRLDGMGR